MAHSTGMLSLSLDESTNRIASGSFDGSFNVSKLNLNKSQLLSTMSVRELKDLLRYY